MRLNSRKKISEWLIKQNLKKDDFLIQDNLLVDVYTNITIFNQDLDSLPVYFNKVKGDFECNQNKIKTTKGFPRHIVGNLLLINNQLALKNYNFFPLSIEGALILDYANLSILEKIIKIKDLEAFHLVGEEGVKIFCNYFNEPISPLAFKSLTPHYLKELITPYLEKKQLEKIMNKNIIQKKIKL